MALNKFMHPRNIYKKPPDFKKLACSNPDFRKHIIQELSGKVTIDFKNAEALRSLTTSLLKQDFGLDVELPLDRLIPTLPLRLNYILWMEDILHVSRQKSEHAIRGIDIGTGASCVYPLLGCKLNNWQFLATELDAENLIYARKNVERNGLSHMIDVECAKEDTILTDVLARFPQTYDFCLCNPPFFADNFEAQGLNSRSDDRAEPHSSSTASPTEQMVCGGEVEFVKRMIQESQALKDRIRIFTSMLGKKSSLVPLKNELRRLQVPSFSSTEFCQGKTMRWGIGWSYDNTVVFPKSAFQTKKKDKPPLVFPVPQETSVTDYSLMGVGDFIKGHLDKLMIGYEEIKSTSEVLSLSVCAKENTWSNMRRKKRQMKREQTTLPVSGELTTQLKGGDNFVKSDIPNANLEDVSSKAPNQDITESDKQSLQEIDSQDPESKKRKIGDEFEIDAVKRPRTDQNTCSEAAHGDNAIRAGEMTVDPSCSSANSSEFLFKCTVSVRCSPEDRITLEMDWVEGKNRESMHQVLQYLKNQFTV